MKKNVMMMVLCAAMMCSMAACGSAASGQKAEDAKTTGTEAQTETDAGTDDGTESADENTQIANPFVEYASADELEKAIGFEFTVPDQANGSIEVLYQACNTDFAEAIYYKNSDEETARIRKGKGTEDISGDYGEYSENTEVTVNDTTVTLKGDNGKVVLATWTSGDYTYSVSTTEITAEEMTALVSEVQ